jgi:hypothetical protein
MAILKAGLRDGQGPHYLRNIAARDNRRCSHRPPLRVVGESEVHAENERAHFRRLSLYTNYSTTTIGIYAL